MISVTRLLGGTPQFDERHHSQNLLAPQSSAAGTGSGPLVVWNATRTCNLECVHCLSDAEAAHVSNELTTAESKAMIEDLARMGVPSLLIAGGEPLVRPDIFALTAYALSLGIDVTLATNGTLLTKEKAKSLATIGVTSVIISIDGDEARHDRMRNRNGAYRDALRGIRNARAAGLRVALRFTVTQDNVVEIDHVFRMVEREGISRLCISHLVYSRHSSYLAGLDLTSEQKRSLMNRLLVQAERWNAERREIEVMTLDNEADAPFLYYWLLDRDPARAGEALWRMKDSGGNGSGIGVAAIDSFGLVHPDQFTGTHTLGSIRERPFSKIWNDSRIELLQRLRDRSTLLQGRCATCQWLCLCNGNFRARAEAVTGDFWEADPGCYLLDSEVISGAPE